MEGISDVCEPLCQEKVTIEFSRRKNGLIEENLFLLLYSLVSLALSRESR
jgi:hypothetical protein